MFIPIGESPGISGRQSVIGTIDAYDPSNRVLTIHDADGAHVAKITEQTKLWLDKSEIRERNVLGTPTDCRPGRLSEIRYRYIDGVRTDEAVWIKVRVPQ